MMLVSRIFLSGLNKYQSACFRRFTSTVSTSKSHEQTNSNEQKSSTDVNSNNEWLWAYLRDRKNFSDLNEEQRRRVIEIGLKN